VEDRPLTHMSHPVISHHQALTLTQLENTTPLNIFQPQLEMEFQLSQLFHQPPQVDHQPPPTKPMDLVQLVANHLHLTALSVHQEPLPMMTALMLQEEYQNPQSPTILQVDYQ
jgi:hypothetical protein